MEKEIALNKIKKLTTNYIVCKSKKYKLSITTTKKIIVIALEFADNNFSDKVDSRDINYVFDVIVNSICNYLERK
jgi:hypothetical protein